MLSAGREEEQALLAVAGAFRRFDWDRFLTGWAVLFHIVVALTLVISPRERIAELGPAVDLASPQAWALIFAAVGILVMGVWAAESRTYRLAVLLAVLLVGGTWLSAFAIALYQGYGSAVPVIAWAFLYVPWLIVAARLASGKR